MKTNETNEQSSHQQEPLASASHEEIASVVAPPLSRRSFFGRVGASTALAAATGVGLPSLLMSKKANAGDDDDDADDSRVGRSFQLRKSAAFAEREVPRPHQVSNGDERRYPNFIGNYSQGLPHDSVLGEVIPAAYQARVISPRFPWEATPSSQILKGDSRLILKVPMSVSSPFLHRRGWQAPSVLARWSRTTGWPYPEMFPSRSTARNQ